MLAPNPGGGGVPRPSTGEIKMKPFAVVSLAACLCITACAQNVRKDSTAADGGQSQAPAQASLDQTLAGDAVFAFGSAELSDAGRAQLDAFAGRIQALSGDYTRILVIGHSDRLGSAKVNVSVSARRAEAVRDYLVQAGIPADRITALGQGSLSPLVQCDEPRGQALIDCLAPNRRVDLHVERP